MELLLESLKDVAVYFVTGVMGYIGFEIHVARKSISELNQNMAVILEKITNHEKIIDHHERRIDHLEHKKEIPK